MGFTPRHESHPALPPRPVADFAQVRLPPTSWSAYAPDPQSTQSNAHPTPARAGLSTAEVVSEPHIIFHPRCCGEIQVSRRMRQRPEMNPSRSHGPQLRAALCGGSGILSRDGSRDPRSCGALCGAPLRHRSSSEQASYHLPPPTLRGTPKRTRVSLSPRSGCTTMQWGSEKSQPDEPQCSPTCRSYGPTGRRGVLAHAVSGPLLDQPRRCGC